MTLRIQLVFLIVGIAGMLSMARMYAAGNVEVVYALGLSVIVNLVCVGVLLYDFLKRAR